MSYPETYDKMQYITWHQNEFESGSNILDKIANFSEESTSFLFNDDKKILNGLFQFINESVRIAKIRRSNINFDITPEIPKNQSEFKQRYLKSENSIINKLWRKNKNQSVVKIDEIRTKLKDLIRFSIKVDSLKSAEILANVFSDRALLSENSETAKEYFKSVLEKIEVDSEMKMSSGYFAYHCYFHFYSQFIIEVQIFSELTNYWRKISHSTYEKARINATNSMKFNDFNSRIISIGHMLYIAECELYNIEKELDE